MKTITAIIRVRPGAEAAMRDALLKVAETVRASEPDTVGFFVSVDETDPCVFTTYERFRDAAARDLHNGSATVAAFFESAGPLIEGEVVLVTSDEIWAK
ncbi:MAG: putative quinol monooxygenase [Paracoccaceae bacterium]